MMDYLLPDVGQDPENIDEDHMILGTVGYWQATGINGEPTSRCHQNPRIRALGIQEPVIPGEPLIKG